jgi:hypothetical protein
MIAVSLLTGVLMLLIFKRTSNQEAIRRAKDLIKAHLLEVRLYKDDLGQSLRAQGAILKANLSYMGHAVRPMLVMIVPIFLVLAQLNLWFGADSLERGERAILKVKLADGWSATGTEVRLDAPAGVVVETPPLRLEEEGEVDWRVRAETPGIHALTIDIGGRTFTKELAVGQKSLSKVPVLRTRRFLDLVLNPGEPPLSKDSGAVSVEVSYPSRHLPFLGWKVNWLVAFFVLSLAFGFALKGFFKVEI